MNAVPDVDRFVQGGTSHIAVLLLTTVLAGALVWCGRRLRGQPGQWLLRRTFALAILLGQGAMQIDVMLPESWSITYSLPLQLCDLAWMVAIYALWTRRTWAAGVLYYWALTLTTQAFITPDLGWDFPAFKFMLFFYGHVAVVVASIYLTWGVGIQPGWSDYRRALVVTVVWGLSVCTLNSLLGTNYGYLNRKPPIASALDFLGPHPFYLASELLLVTVVWGLMTWPWTRQPRMSGPLLAESRLHGPAIRSPSRHEDELSFHQRVAAERGKST